MSLSRSKPLPSHDFPAEGEVRTCRDCGAEWDTRFYGNPPPWACKRKPLNRGKRMKAISDTNSGREHQRDKAFREYVRHLPCCACGKEPPSDPHHVRSRGAGFGDWIDGRGNLVSLCRMCHRSLDDVGGGKQTFEDYWDISLAAEAERIGERYGEER